MSYGGDRDSGFRQTYLSNFDKAGAGGLYTTIEDLAAWDRNFETGEVGGPAFLELIQTPGVLTSGDTLNYGFGLTLGQSGGRPTVGHSGSFMGFRADFVRFPEEGMSVAALCNLGGINPSALTRAVVRETLGSEAPVAQEGGSEASAREDERGPPPAPSTLALRAYTGEYRSDEVGSSVRIEWTGSQLRGVRPGTESSQVLEWVEGDRFRLEGWTLEFDVDDGVAQGFRLDAGRVRNLHFVRVEP